MKKTIRNEEVRIVNDYKPNGACDCENGYHAFFSECRVPQTQKHFDIVRVSQRKSVDHVGAFLSVLCVVFVSALLVYILPLV